MPRRSIISIMRFLLLALALGAIVGSVQQGWLATAVNWWKDVAKGKTATATAASLEGRTVTSVLAVRQRVGAPPLVPDLEMQDWLLKRTETGGMEPDDVVNGARMAMPQYEKLTVFQSHSATADGLLDQITAWPNLVSREFNHI